VAVCSFTSTPFLIENDVIAAFVAVNAEKYFWFGMPPQTVLQLYAESLLHVERLCVLDVYPKSHDLFRART
jgi:hypothetical protein